MDKNKSDQFFMRAKDLVLIVGAIAGLATASNNFLSLPQTVQRHDSEIKTLQQIVSEYKSANELTVQALRQDMGYLTRNVEEIKQIVKAAVSHP